MLRPARLFLLTLACVGLASSGALATTVLSVPVEELAKGSPVVVRGVVEARETAWDKAHLNIETHTTIRVTQRLKGEAGATVVVNQVGGEVDGKGQYVPGDAKFKVGEEVVVFLEARPGGEFVLTGMAMAKFRVITRDGRTYLSRDLSGLSFAARDAQGMIQATEKAPAAEIELDALARLLGVTVTPAPTKLRAN